MFAVPWRLFTADKCVRSARQVAADCNNGTNGHHWTFDRFHGFDPEADLFNYEYFEWTDLFEAALDADKTFTFIELGAGFGRWTERAARVARRLCLRPTFVMVEADPEHIISIRQKMAERGIVDYELFEGAVAASHGKAQFIVQAPPQFYTEHGWYGQSLVRSAGMNEGGNQIPETYGGHALHALGSGWNAIEVTTYSLDEVLSNHAFVDLIDVDIQGAEGEVIPRARKVLNRKCRRLHIETHWPEVEEQCRASLSADQWICLRDFPDGSTQQTPFGTCTFIGGIQCWINPRLY